MLIKNFELKKLFDSDDEESDKDKNMKKNVGYSKARQSAD